MYIHAKMEQPRLVKQTRAFQGWIASYKMEVPNDLPKGDLILFNNAIENELIRAIRQEINDLGSIKFSYTMRVNLRKRHKQG